MPDVAIVNTTVAAEPKDYKLTGTQELLLKSVRASIDGSGAGSAFRPTLQMLAPDGTVMWQAFPSSSTAAGGTADVTWFPHIGSGESALSNPGLMACRVNIVGNQPITVDGNDYVVTWGEAPIDAGNPTPFWNAATPTRLTAPVDGAYLSLGNLEWDNTITVDTTIGHYIFKNGDDSTFDFLYEFSDTPRLSSSGAASAGYILMGGHHGIFHLNAGDYLETFAYAQPSAGVPNPVNLIDLRPAQNHYASWSLILVATS